MKTTDLVYEAKFRRATEVLDSTGIWKSNYLPPATRLLRRIGFSVRPPHFVSFANTAISCAAYFSAVWGLSMWLLVWSSQGIYWGDVVTRAMLAGMFFGVAMAAYYAYGRMKYKLPSWENLLHSDNEA
ncbi:hypothetical protein HA050_07210 [Iodobacter sp. HSC-16F04]|uniref:Uncharacterized protein n=1 Tax=Iodobacter violaceini TaxID=3044271 RepID=A0ABX0KU64_9NEIS|nr:DUF6404 family protein [Iodobacter violacea]NHQ85905.1 hypothetical protein [Iodobacter violacea]